MKAFLVVSLLVLSVTVSQGRYLSKRDVSNNFKLCLEVLLLNCDHTYRPEGDETVCASNGITYSNLCHYSQARCAKTNLKLVYAGHCGRTTPAPPTPPPTTRIPTTTMPTTTMPTTTMPTTTMPTSTMARTTMPTTTVVITTMPPTTMPTTNTPTPALTSGTVPPITVDPGLDIIKQIFCQQAAHIVCNTELEPICGTDGIFYLNRCTFAKAECSTAGLEPQELDLCKDN